MNQKGFGYVPLQSKQWRAITYDYLGLASNSDVSRLYCLTDFQVAWIMSNVTYYNWMTRWTNQNATQDELNIQQAELENALMSCIQLQPYQIEYLYDQQVSETLDVYNSDFDSGGIAGLNPNTPTDFYSGDDSEDRLNALCSACNIYVRSYAQNWIKKAQATLAIVAVFGIVASISIVGGVIASVLVGGLVLITKVALDAMQDSDALDKVICCMNTELQGLAITEANFETSLDACSFVVGSNEAIIRDIIASDLDKKSNWLSFINSIGDAFVLSEAGVYSCPCTDFEWFAEWLNGNGDPSSDGWVASFGTYNGGTDEMDWAVWSNSSRAVVQRFTFTADTTIRELRMTGRIFQESGNRTQKVRIFDEFDVLQDDAAVTIDSTPNNQNWDVKLDGVNIAVESGWYLTFQCFAIATESFPNGTIFVETMRVDGDGVNPFD